jgi:hypothetical protein
MLDDERADHLKVGQTCDDGGDIFTITRLDEHGDTVLIWCTEVDGSEGTRSLDRDSVVTISPEPAPIYAFLQENDCDTLAEWGRKNDYLLTPDDGWVDLDDSPVILRDLVLAAIEAGA